VLAGRVAHIRWSLGDGQFSRDGLLVVTTLAVVCLINTMGVSLDHRYKTKNRRRGILALLQSLFCNRKKQHIQDIQHDVTHEEDSVMSEVMSYIPPPTQPGILRHYQGRSSGRYDDEASLVSIDSLVNSYWDPEDGSTTMIIHNEPPELVMNEHMNFLRTGGIRTQTQD
jgi:hypothetical protein